MTIQEFTCDLDLNAGVSFDRVCGRFVNDANRALVWFIRFQALICWCKSKDAASWLSSDPGRAQHASALAASFDLNEDWQFDPALFRSAVELYGRGE